MSSKADLLAKCKAKGIPCTGYLTVKKLQQLLEFDAVKYKPVTECVYLVFGDTKWGRSYCDNDTSIERPSRDRYAFTGTPHSPGYTCWFNQLDSLRTGHFDLLTVVDPDMLFVGGKLDKVAATTLRRVSKKQLFAIETIKKEVSFELNAFFQAYVVPATILSAHPPIVTEYIEKNKKEEKKAQKRVKRYGSAKLLENEKVEERLAKLYALATSVIPSTLVVPSSKSSLSTLMSKVEEELFLTKFCESIKCYAAYRYDLYSNSSLDEEDKTELLTSLMPLFSCEPDSVKKGIIEGITDTREGFGSLVGRTEVKEYVADQLLSFAAEWRSFGKTFTGICLMGKAGSGKTTIGLALAYLYGKCSIYATSDFTMATRSDLVGSHVGHTAIKTKELCVESLEGVLLIDEAYQLCYKDVKEDFGAEAISELVNFLDKYMACSIVIVAGYEKEMKDKFFDGNEGLNRRFPSKVVLKDYTTDELNLILVRKLATMIASSDSTLTKGLVNYIYTVLSMLSTVKSPLFPEGLFVQQGGDMLNLAARISRTLNALTLEESSTLSDRRDAVDTAVQLFLETKAIET
jgi:hypothetical protein